MEQKKYTSTEIVALFTRAILKVLEENNAQNDAPTVALPVSDLKHLRTFLPPVRERKGWDFPVKKSRRPTDECPDCGSELIQGIHSMYCKPCWLAKKERN